MVISPDDKAGYIWGVKVRVSNAAKMRGGNFIENRKHLGERKPEA